MRPSYTNYDFIRPGLAVGGRPDAPAALAGLFDAVLDLLPAEEPGRAAAYAALGIAYRHFPLRDGQLPGRGLRALDPLVAWIAEQRAADRRVLVHCQGGSSRAPFVAAYYLLRTEGGDADALVRDLQRRRPAAAMLAVAFRRALHAAVRP